MAGVDQIFLYRNGQNTKITANIYNKNIGIESLQINNQGQIAWSQLDYNPNPDGTGLNQNVYLYDGSTYKPLNDNQGQYSWYSRYPCLNNRGEVAWLQSYQPGVPDNNLWDVYLYTGGGVTRLTNDLSQQGPPRLNDNGWVTWHGNRSQDWDNDNRIYLYNGAEPQVIAYTPGQHCSAPQINNLGQVAWRKSSSPVYNLYLWNGTNTKITNLDATNYDGQAPFSLNNNGQILWGWGDVRATTRSYIFMVPAARKKSPMTAILIIIMAWPTTVGSPGCRTGADDWRTLCLPEREFLSSGYGGRLCGTIHQQQGPGGLGQLLPDLFSQPGDRFSRHQ